MVHSGDRPRLWLYFNMLIIRKYRLRKASGNNWPGYCSGGSTGEVQAPMLIFGYPINVEMIDH